MNLWSSGRLPAAARPRSERVGRASRRAIRQWRERAPGALALSRGNAALEDTVSGATLGEGPLMRPISPPAPLLPRVTRSATAQAIIGKREVFRAGILQTAWRLVFWMLLAIKLLAGNSKDWILRKSTVERRARRLRLVLQSGGATFVKIGQQLSLRIDLLPYQYASELEKMLDKVPPFPAAHAIEAIEDAIGGPLDTVFAAFDPKPIGSASMSCVYQGILHGGERVAIKVRRPGVGKLLAADMRALGWLMFVAEFFVLPPGFTDNLVDELRGMLMAELDFRMEARATDLFRRRVRKARLRYVTAPRIHFELSSSRVIVAEFVTGAWLTDVLATVENDDQAAMAVLREHNINPKRVARRLLEVTRWAGYEGLLFHADLHPANVLVRPNSKLTLIDFGSFGAFTLKDRTVWRRLMQAQHDEDVGAMAQAAIGLLEPLPPVDIDELTKKVEQIFWDHLYAYKSKQAEWWERTSAQVWISFLSLSREMQIPMNLNTLKMIRASMLVDTLALRLDRKVDQYKEFTKYLKGAGKRSYKRVTKKIREFFQPTTFVELEDLFGAARGFVYQLKRTAESASTTTSSLIGKASYAMSCLIQLTLVYVVTMVVGLGIVAARHYMNDIDGDLWAMGKEVLHSTPYQVFLLLAFLVYGRRIAFRLLDTDDD